MSVVVVKIGSSSLTDALGVIDTAMIESLCAQVVSLRRGGHRIVIVTSVAVSAGVAALGMAERPTDMPTLQALSAAGQSRLMRVYDDVLAAHGVVGAQVLLTPHDFFDRQQYLHARQTLQRLLELGCVPVVNENDAIADDELRFGDNDRLAALVAHLIGADVVVLLTDTPGLFTADPRTDPTAALVLDVGADDPILGVRAGVSGTNRGSGGMASKLSAARMASWSGVQAVIAQANRPGVVAAAVAAEPGVGTVFRPNTRRLPARKLWIAFASSVAGSVTVDDGARRALVERGRSLLPAGVVSVEGAFDDGEVIEVRGADGIAFARGLALVSADALRRVAGSRTDALPDGMAHEVVHRDDLVLLPG